MNFEKSEIQKEVQSLVRKFVETEISPIVTADEHTETFRPEIIRKLGELGLTGIPTPEKWNGMGLGYQEYTGAIEELAKGSGAYAISVAVSGLPQVILNQFGTEAQKQKYIPPLASGQAIGAFSLSEAFSGSDAGALRTTAKRDGKEYVLNGTKLWCTQGDVASTIILMARTGEDGPKGVSAFILDAGTKGLSAGKREKKMGMHISHTVELVLENVRIPSDRLIGTEGQGFKIAMEALDSGRITIGATAVGVARAALELAVRYASERQQFGRSIDSFQGVSFMLADMATQIEAADLLVKRAAWLKDNEKKYSLEAAMAKMFASDVAMQVTTDAVQVLGGAGYTADFPAERYMREAKVLQIVEGTNQIQRLVIAKELTRASRETL